VIRWSLLIILLIGEVQAFDLLESLVLGELNRDQVSSQTDPLSFIRLNEKHELSQEPKYREVVAKYLAMFEEGENLRNQCDRLPDTSLYSNDWSRRQATRAVAATLQYLTLDVSIKAIAQYARKLEYSSDEYNNLVNRLVGNYCSPNITIISHKQLRKYMETLFSGENSYKLPGMINNPLFPEKLVQRYSDSLNKTTAREFHYTIELFKSACTWANDDQDFRMLVPLLRSPYIMATIIRQLSSEKLMWDSESNKSYKKIEKETLKVACENLICRKSDNTKFTKVFPRALGTNSLREDLELLYCRDLRTANFKLNTQEEKIKRWITQRGVDFDALLEGQLLALVTGIPEYFLWNRLTKNMTKVIRASVDRTWNKWAKKANRGFAQEVTFEEPLLIERMRDPFRYHTPTKEEPLQVTLDVNLGELDRVYEYQGKLSAEFTLKLRESFLSWMSEQWKNTPLLEKNKRYYLMFRLKEEIKGDIAEAKQQFALPPWQTGMEDLIAQELMEQINLLPRIFSRASDKEVKIPIMLRYGPFALRYLGQKMQFRATDRKSLQVLNR
jgi:hypothetical protein